MAFAAPAPGPPSGQGLLDALLADMPPPEPPSDGLIGRRTARFRRGVDKAAAEHLERALHCVAVATRADPYDTPLPLLYAGEAGLLWTALERAESAIERAGFELATLTDEARRLRGRLLADLRWLLFSGGSFHRLYVTELLLAEAGQRLDESERSLETLETMPLRVAGDLQQLNALLGEHERAAAGLIGLQVGGGELDRELALARRARLMIEALPPPLSGDREAALRLSPRLVAAAAAAIGETMRSLAVGLDGLRRRREELRTLDALRNEVVRLVRTTEQGRAELQRLRRAPVLTMLSQQQGRAAALVGRRKHLDLAELGPMTSELKAAMRYFLGIQQQLEEATQATRQLLDAAPLLQTEVGALERLLRQGEAGSFPLTWGVSARRLAELSRAVAALAQLPPLEKPTLASAELRRAQELDGELKRLRAAIALVMQQRELLRRQRLDALFRRTAPWVAEMQALRQEVERYGPPNWPTGLTSPRLDQAARRIAERAAALPQPDVPLAEEQVARAADELSRLIADVEAFDERVATLRQQLRELDAQALGAARRLDQVEALLNRVLATAPEQQALREHHARVVELQRRLRPPIRARLSDLAQLAGVLELQSTQSSQDFAELLRTGYTGGLQHIERLIRSIQGRAALHKDSQLLDQIARTRALQLRPFPARPAESFAQAVADIELLTPLMAEARMLSEGLGNLESRVQRHWSAVGAAAQRAQDGLRRTALLAADWPMVEVNLARAEQQLQRAGQLSAQIAACATMRAFEGQVRRTIEAYQRCWELIEAEEDQVVGRRQRLLAVEQQLLRWREERLARCEHPSVQPEQARRAREYAQRLGERLSRLRERHSFRSQELNPRFVERELATMWRLMQQEERERELPPLS